MVFDFGFFIDQHELLSLFHRYDVVGTNFKLVDPLTQSRRH